MLDFASFDRNCERADHPGKAGADRPFREGFVLLVNAARRVSRSAGGRYSATLAAIVLLVATFTGLTSAANASSATACAAQVVRPATALRGAALPARVLGTNCANGVRLDPHAPGMSPPLIWHKGAMMSTQSTLDSVTVTPIYWAPSGYSFTSAYRSLINQYLIDVSADSDKATNVFSTTWEYHGSNGFINYRVNLGMPILDRNAYPKAGCTRNAGAIYSDKTTYKTCIDDLQVRAEVNKQVKTKGMAHGLGNIYVMLLPKRVETCYYAGNPKGQQCSLNATRSAAFCGYHSEAAQTHVVYANMPYPIYHSPLGYTCGNDGGFSKEQTPNGNLDADSEISPLSHEINEAITDPDTSTGWFDKNGNENGDECAYEYGPAHGGTGAKWNQTINGHHYLTQEEFSNNNYKLKLGGCMQNYVPAAAPTLVALSQTSGSIVGGDQIAITGTTLAGASQVLFGTTPATAIQVIDPTTLMVTVPQATETGPVDVTVQNSLGTSPVVPVDQYTYTS
jgi:hypothetical protein